MGEPAMPIDNTTGSKTDKRRYKLITVRRVNDITYHLTIGGVMWSEVEWSQERRAWCVQDAAGMCLTHVESIVGQNPDPQEAIRLAKKMIVDGRMPTPEEAYAQRAEREKSKALGELIVGDITAGSEAEAAPVKMKR
jgi:hypothetical protein